MCDLVYGNFVTPLLRWSQGKASGVQLSMRPTIQIELDGRSRKRLALLVRELGWTPSQVVREGLRVLEANCFRLKKPCVIAFGQFGSGVPDLGSNKKHMRRFGL